MAIETTDLRVVMLGPRGVGKTSFLASMWFAFKAGLFEKTWLDMVPNTDTAVTFEQRLEELRSVPARLVSPGGQFIIDSDARFGILKTNAIDDYVVTVLRPSASRRVRITFRDYPGERFLADFKKIEQDIGEATAIVVAIDTPALMEAVKEGWDWLNDQHNKPSLIAQALRTLSNTKGRKIVLFVPVRCEAYIRDEDERELLLSRIKAAYAEPLRVLEPLQNVAAVITPVQTIGTIYFHSLVPRDPAEPASNSNYAFEFRKMRADHTYKPKDTEQPLRYLFRFILSLEIALRQAQRRTNVGSTVNGIKGELRDLLPDGLADFLGEIADVGGEMFAGALNLFGDWAYKDAVETFAGGSKTDPPFQIVQGQKLLDYSVL